MLAMYTNKLHKSLEENGLIMWACIIEYSSKAFMINTNGVCLSLSFSHIVDVSYSYVYSYRDFKWNRLKQAPAEKSFVNKLKG